MNQENVFVNEIACHQRLNQLSTPHYDEILPLLTLQLRHGVCCVPLEEGGVHPWKRLFERPRGHVLLDVIHPSRVGAIFPLGPDVVELLIGPSPDEQASDVDHSFARLGHRLVMSPPSPMLEASARVFVGPGRALHYAVKRQVHEDKDFQS